MRSMTGQDSATTESLDRSGGQFLSKHAGAPAHIVLSGVCRVTDVAWWRFGQKRGLLTDCTFDDGCDVSLAFTSAGSVGRR